MEIVVISDTHLSSPDYILEKEYDTQFSKADILVHCGDYTSEDVWAYLNSHPYFLGVAGNMDSGYWAHNLNHQLVIKFKGIKIGILHGYDLDFSRIEIDITSRFPEDVNFIFFGHTHTRFFKQVGDDKYIINPGSFTFPKGHKQGYVKIRFSNIGEIGVQWVDL